MTTEPVAVVTGGATGIGGATVARLLDQGWTVHALDLVANKETAAQEHTVDVTDAERLVGTAEDIGPVDAIVTAAGVNLRPADGPAQRLSLDAWDKTLAVNLTGTMLTVRAFYPKLRDGGAIVTLGSTAGIAATPWSDAYTASKGAVIALTRSWAADYSRYGIRVNCVCPGNTDTAMLEGILGDIPEDQRSTTPQQRSATREEIAAVITFLASPEPSYLSGTIIPVDGGASALLAGLPFPTRRTRPKPERHNTQSYHPPHCL